MNEMPVAADVLALLESLPAGPAGPLSAQEMRDAMTATAKVFQEGAATIPVSWVEEPRLPGDVKVRTYSPSEPDAVIVYFHGGSWVAGGLDTHDLVTRRLSRDLSAVVVSVEYRKIPEHPFPAPFDDAWTATVWAAQQHPYLPLVVAGDSAGGTLAACVALKARDEHGPAIDGQVLIYPAIDEDPDVPSMATPAAGALMTAADVLQLISAYAGTEAAKDSPYALPGRAASLAGLPPAVVVLPGHDLLRSSGERYAQRLQDAGVPVTVQLDLDLVHAWVEFAETVPTADRAFARLTANIDALLP